MGGFDLGLLDVPCLLTGYGGILVHSPGCLLSVNRLCGLDLVPLDATCQLADYGRVSSCFPGFPLSVNRLWGDLIASS